MPSADPIRLPAARSAAALRDAAARILGVLREEMLLEVPAADTDLFASGLLDSLGFVDLLARLEEAFDRPIDLATIDLERFRTAEEIARVLGASERAR